MHLAGFAALACGHGTIVWPPSRFNGTWKNGGSCVSAGNPILPGQPCASPAFQDKKPPPNCVPGGSCLWFNQGCTIGCDKCGDSDGKATCKGQGKPTLPAEFRTWTGMHPYPTPGYGCKVNPWCAPGSAPVFDPCGITGGGFQPGKNGNGGVPPDFYKQGFKGSDVPWGHGPVTKWVIGQTYDVAWAITANHGGGYQYRLCPKDKAAVGGQEAEKCFQSTPLKFANAGTQWIQWGDDDQTRLAIPAMTVTTGVVPAGSQWRRNPIPACTSIGGSGGAIHTPCTGFEFTPPGVDREYPPGFPARAGKKLGGFGAGACDSGENNCGDPAYAKEMFAWSIVDQVTVPAGLSAGDYVLSFRWESEQTPQIWSGCTDLTIAVSGDPAPPHPHPPLPTPPSAAYSCQNAVCVSSADGVPLATCQAACG